MSLKTKRNKTGLIPAHSFIHSKTVKTPLFEFPPQKTHAFRTERPVTKRFSMNTCTVTPLLHKQVNEEREQVANQLHIVLSSHTVYQSYVFIKTAWLPKCFRCRSYYFCCRSDSALWSVVCLSIYLSIDLSNLTPNNFKGPDCKIRQGKSDWFLYLNYISFIAGFCGCSAFRVQKLKRTNKDRVQK